MREHSAQNCYVNKVFMSEGGSSRNVKLDSMGTLVMIESGEQPSVLELNFVNTHKSPFFRETSFVLGLASHPVEVCGTTNIPVDVGDGRTITQRFCKIVSPEPTVFLS